MYSKCTYYFLVIDTTLELDNHLCFTENLLKRIWKLMASDYEIRDGNF